MRARTRARSQHPTRATHARERKSRETGSSSPGKRAAVRGGNGSDGEERCGVWSLGPARHRGCHIDSRYRAESIATEPIPRDFQPASFATFVQRAHAGNAEKQRSLQWQESGKESVYTRARKRGAETRRGTSSQTRPVEASVRLQLSRHARCTTDGCRFFAHELFA